MGFQIGNKLGSKPGKFAGAIRRYLAAHPEDLHTVIAQQFSAAKAGNVVSAGWLADRLDGKAKQSTEVTGANGSALFPVTSIAVTGVEPAAVVTAELERISESTDV